MEEIQPATDTLIAPADMPDLSGADELTNEEGLSISFDVMNAGGRVVLYLGEDLGFYALTQQQAKQFARKLRTHADIARQKSARRAR